MRAWVLLIAFLLVPAAPAATRLTTFDRAALQPDVDVLQLAYEALHPRLYRYNTPDTMRSHFATLRKELDGRISWSRRGQVLCLASLHAIQQRR